MSETAIQAIERTEKPKQVRKNGFIPGVIYGKDMDSITVKFDEKKLHKILQGRSEKARIPVIIGNETKQCFIEEIQRDPVQRNPIHISMHVVKKDQVIKMKVPIIYNGHEKLAEKRLIFQPYTTEFELTGPSVDIPENIVVDVAEMSLGDKVEVKDISVNPSLTVLEDPEKILAVVTASRTNLPTEDEDSSSEE